MHKKYLVDKIKKLLFLKKQQAAKAKNAVILRWKKPVPTPQPVRPSPKPAPQPVKPIEHLLNDPLTPDMVSYVTSPPSPPVQSPYVVKSYRGGGFGRGTVEYQAASAYITIAETLNLFNSNLADKKIPRWHRTASLTVSPRAGIDLNAFYDGKSLQFFHFTHQRIGGSVFTVDSADIVSHECGHAILDCYRPDLWDAAFIEVGAFHESFGDFCALMHALQHDQMINKALQETGGDLSKSNVVSRMAEQFGRAIYRIDPTGRSPDYLRNAVNTFKYVDPGTLSDDSPDNQLSAEIHNFSRVFTGAVYDVFFAIFRKVKNSGINPLDSVKVARDTVCHYMIKAIVNAPLNARFYESVAKTMLWADATVNGGKYQSEMQAVFEARNLVGMQLSIMSAPKCPNEHNIVKTCNHHNTRLSDVCVQSLDAGSFNPLYEVELEMPAEEAQLYDADGNLQNCVYITEDESIKAAQDFVHFLQRNSMVGPDKSTPWEIRNGKLVRTRTCCCHH